MRKHLTPATVLAALALFISMSGTAAASIIISSNHQVGAHTIAGANAPTGDNRNLISGSVGNSDLHNNAVTGAKVADRSLTGSDLANTSVGDSKLKLPKINWTGLYYDPDDGKPHHTVLSLDGVTVGVSCLYSSQQSAILFDVYLASTAANASQRSSFVTGTGGAAASSSIAEHAVSSTPTLAAEVTTSAPRVLLSGQTVYHDTNRIIALTLDGSVDGLYDRCDLHGVAVPAPN